MAVLKIQILESMVALFEGITADAGYFNTVAGSVFYGRNLLGEDEGLPSLTIIEPPQLPDPLNNPKWATGQQTEFNVIVQGFAEDDHKSPTKPAYELLADVMRALALEQKRASEQDSRGLFDLNFAVERFVFGNPIVRPPDQGVSASAYFWLPIQMTIVEDFLANHQT